MTKLIFLSDSYRQNDRVKIVSVEERGKDTLVVLDQTIFYPQGGGQPSDRGEIVGPNGRAKVKHVRMHGDNVVHECVVEGQLNTGDEVECTIDWDWRYRNMRRHSAGHIVHEAVMLVAPQLIPIKGKHSSPSYIEYKGSLTIDKAREIELKTNEIVQKNLALTTEFVTLEELKARASYVPEHLPTNKPLRILAINGFQPIPDGGTQVISTSEVGPITMAKIENSDNMVRVYYAIDETSAVKFIEPNADANLSAAQFIGFIIETEQEAKNLLASTNLSSEILRNQLLGSRSEFARLTKEIKNVIPADRQRAGMVLNEVKKNIEKQLEVSRCQGVNVSKYKFFDVTAPGIPPAIGHLHIVTQAIMEIARIFEKIGFTRVRHPEVDWDWYPFEALNMPPDHPARDEWETFFIDPTGFHPVDRQGGTLSKMVLTPHTSNGQVREMDKGKLPIRMINIAKCYRRQSDVSHVPMFHQFEGMYIDKGVTIGDLTGVFDFFVKNYFGPDRKVRLRPFHFQFTEPSVEIDINCGICLGKGCTLCKEGWLEMAGGGMIHPVVFKNGGIDPNVYSGFAFGWGVERAYMMKSGTKLDDIRLLYSNDVRFLEQF